MSASLDWAHEWLTSLIWTGKAFAITVIVFTVVVALLARYTHWGRQFRRIGFPYFRPGRSWVSWRPLLTLALMLWLTALAVRLSLLFTFVNNDFITALQKLDSTAFWYAIAIAGVLMAVVVVISLLGTLINETFVIQWQVWLTDHMVADWLKGSAHHRGRFVTAPVDNPDQRIQEDIASFVTQTHWLAMGAVDAALSLVSFTALLWGLSGPLSVVGREIPHAMVFLVYLYVVVASVLAFRTGRPLIRLNFLGEGLGASFRYALVRLRDNSEDIAFYRGEDAERMTLAARFAAVIQNRWAIVFRSLKLQGVNDTATQVATVFPFVIQAPRLFAGAITLGDITQTGQAFDSVQESLSFFRNSYEAFAAYRATLDRLTGLLEANKQSRALPSLTAADHPDALEIEDLTVRRPDGRPLIGGLSLSLNPGQALLIKGASGSGKTTLLRSLANLWPHAQGSVWRPTDGHTLFLTQRPYLPLGTLRTALAYPQRAHRMDDEQVPQVLHSVHLGHLADRLDDETDWSRILSPGEQQRLGFARILLSRPRLAFLDEATSALDEGLEHALYTLTHDELPECMLVSVGHRSTLNTLHTHHLQLLGAGRWSMAESPQPTAASRRPAPAGSGQALAQTKK
ncbi:ABC transporter ATP-binding protein/permease [Streptomyces sp. NPDC101151]|uniref:ABC transporter ATP-binding protein/permease n=1 Tax=Streptomyces sp. NPDC101151 TaxID=3366115 RepID=UPI003826F45B